MKVIVNGANGRMGQATVNALAEDPTLQCVATLGRNDDLATALSQTKADIVVDFTTPDVVYDNTQLIIAHNVHPIIGTTGLTAAQMTHCQALAAEKKLGGIIAPNFSLGAILMMRFASLASRYFPDAEIIEYHHPHKLDAPSGTAIKTAALIAQARTQASTIPAEAHARGECHHQVPIHSCRLPGFIASQQVVFGGQAESLTIQHHTLDRSCFMPGVLLACHRVHALKELVYGLESLVE
jgi:4-hydroxy-tetrahydrodipicolinate reductase